MHLPFMMIPSITAMSSLNDQYGAMSWCNWSLLSGHNAIIKHFNHDRCSSCAVTHCICWIDMHSGTLVDVYTASNLMSIPLITSSLIPCGCVGITNLQEIFLALACILF